MPAVTPARPSDVVVRGSSCAPLLCGCCPVTVSMRVMSSGDGFRYLLKSVAVGDGGRLLSTPLTRYYTEEGTPPGRWMGSGLGALGEGQLAKGDRVSEVQLQLLIGTGHDPVTAAPLGRPYPVFRSVTDRVAERVAALEPALVGEARQRAETAIEVGERARGGRRAVAGYDFTFSVPKSASVLWGVADARTQAAIVEAHHGSVADVLAFMERELASTRVGVSAADGAVAQVAVSGLIAAAFDHFDSRAGDPHLHTHVVVSNKVSTVMDERWRSLDGRPLHAATVALSELHEAVFADRLSRVLGVGWEQRARGRDRNPGWSIAAVPEALVGEFSSRSRHIEVEKDRLIAAYLTAHWRQPSRATIIRLRQQATLSTRPDKVIRSLADLTGGWRTRATAVLGREATDWASGVVRAAGAVSQIAAEDVSPEARTALAESVVEVVGEKRSTWRRWNLYAEAVRQTRGWSFVSTAERETLLAGVVEAAEHASLRLTPPEMASTPELYRRADGTSCFRPRYSTVYSSEALLAAEDRLLQRGRDRRAPTIEAAAIENVMRGRSASVRLGEDQRSALTAVATSGRVLDVLVGPAGAGKTTAMRGLRRAWESQYGPGSVEGFAPSAAAAQVLADDLEIETENMSMWWQRHRTTGHSFVAGQLVIVDEASLGGTSMLDRIAHAASEAGAKLLLVGDFAQLQAVDAGGAFAMLVNDREDAPELTDIRRFRNQWEGPASLDLRHGRDEAIDAYVDHDRICGGNTEEMTQGAYAAWSRDRAAGLSTVLITDRGETVTELNRRARADLVLQGLVDASREVPLHDGSHASPGDVIITRRNDRRLRSGRDWVRNGDRWEVTSIHADQAVTIRRPGRRWGGRVVLPAGYVAEHVELGYAITAHRAQGSTVDTAHVLVDPSTTREQLYVGLTRGRSSNVAYVATDRPDDAHTTRNPAVAPDATARGVLAGVFRHAGAEPSAHETIAAEQQAWTSIAQLAAEYETIAAAAQHDRWAALIHRSGLTASEAEVAVASDAFGPLTAELRRAEAHHHNVGLLLPRLVAARGFNDADDIAAVLRTRLIRATAVATGSARARRTPRLIVGIIPEAGGPMGADMAEALQQRRGLIEQRAHVLTETARSDREPWVVAMGPEPRDPARASAWRALVRIVAAYRDRYGITGERPLGGEAITTAQQLDASRARMAIEHACRLAAEVGSDASTPGECAPRRSGLTR